MSPEFNVWQSPYGFIGDSRRVVHNNGGFDVFSAGPDTVTACNNDLDDAIPGKLAADGIVDCSTDPLSQLPQDNRAYNGLDDDSNGIIDDRPEFGPEATFNGYIDDDVANWDSRRTP